MNCMKISLVLALCVAVALSSPCADQCTGACNIGKTACDASVVLGPICAINHGACLQGCGNICACVDGCEASCSPAKETCDAAATTVLARAQCVVENDVCIVDCQALCGAQKVVETVGALVQLGLGA